MNLTKLLSFYLKKKQQLVKETESKLRQIPLIEILEELKIENVSSPNYNNIHRFQVKDPVHFYSHQHNYVYSLLPNKLTVTLRNESFDFVGEEISLKYQQICEHLLKEKQKDLENLPF